jgi:Holliday junction resolvase RusA-like endonuclease
MIESQKIRVRGIPYPHTKSTGNVQGCADWTAAVVEKTRGLPKITGPCLLRATFKLPREKFNGASPFGTDLDNLLKRLLDALSRTVFSDAPGKDACVVSLEATKVLVRNPSEAGVDGEIIQIGAPTNALGLKADKQGQRTSVQAIE